MSKITNDGLTRFGTRCFLAQLYPYGNSGRQGVRNWLFLVTEPDEYAF